MCGRFALFAPASQIAESFGVAAVPDLRARYNIAPSQDILAIFEDSDGERVAKNFRWGLVPSWAKDPKIGYKLTNARSETARSKPSFRSAFKKRRLLVPMDGFYEWVRDGKTKLPYYIHGTVDEPLAIAGLWEFWRNPVDEEEEVFSATMLTTSPNELMANIHNRMPVILPKSKWDRWLDTSLTDGDEIETFLTQFPSDQMDAHRVSTEVNNARNQGEQLKTPLADGEE